MSIIPKSIVSKVSRQILIAKKNSPTIFFVGGIGCVITGAVLACRSTLKLSSTLDEAKKEIDEMQKLVPEDEYLDQKAYNTFYIHGKAGFKVVRLYGPALLIGSAGIAALAGSHISLVRRNTALMAAYAAVSKAYDDYRDRVREELGADRELEIYHSAKTELVRTEDGTIIEGKVVDPNSYSPYARFFDASSFSWEKDPEMNRLYVQAQQNHLNNRLIAYGHVFLNEAYDSLGIERSKAGAVVGWVYPSEEGDGYIDFGIFKAFNAAFVNGWEASILLDFNVDGVIYDKI